MTFTTRFTTCTVATEIKLGKHKKPKNEAEKTAEWFDENWNAHAINGGKRRVAEKISRWNLGKRSTKK